MRYVNRTILSNSSESYKKYLKDRDLRLVRHFNTAIFNYPTEDEIQRLELIPHTWKYGDKLFKLSYTYYEDPSLWWVISWFNKKPTEMDINLGDVIYIPFPVERVLGYFSI